MTTTAKASLHPLDESAREHIANAIQMLFALSATVPPALADVQAIRWRLEAALRQLDDLVADWKGNLADARDDYAGVAGDLSDLRELVAAFQYEGAGIDVNWTDRTYTVVQRYKREYGRFPAFADAVRKTAELNVDVAIAAGSIVHSPAIQRETPSHG